MEKSVSIQGTTMICYRQQATIAKPVRVSGFGFWSGQDVTIEFRPAPIDHGVVFVRTDHEAQPQIRAILKNRLPGPRRTSLAQNGTQVDMVEHVLAALAGLQIDNCELRINGQEIPGLDGSSAPFTEALLSAKIVRQSATRQTLKVLKPIRIEEGDSWMEAKPVSSPCFRVNYLLNYPTSPAIGQQNCSVEVNQSTFVNDLASARTFLLESEAMQLQQQGLGNRVSFEDILVFDHKGPIRNQLRFENECARHKALDIIGDFALAGRDWIGEFTASRTGHHLNARMIAAVEQQNSLQPILHSA